MDPAIKKVAIVLAAALIVVIGLIFVVSGSDKEAAAVVTNESETNQIEEPIVENTQTPETQEANAEDMPADVADAGEVSKTNEAPDEDEAAQEEVMYEGALAGLSEEEIAKMALAEEQGSERSNTSGAEDSVD
ncbi:MAG: hypothetical protein E7321_00905 [Clostridiales bacterium]|nr:hypothetical protein [Clostridiales bacterium]